MKTCPSSAMQNLHYTIAATASPMLCYQLYSANQCKSGSNCGPSTVQPRDGGRREKLRSSAFSMVTLFSCSSHCSKKVIKSFNQYISKHTHQYFSVLPDSRLVQSWLPNMINNFARAFVLYILFAKNGRNQNRRGYIAMTVISETDNWFSCD